MNRVLTIILLLWTTPSLAQFSEPTYQDWDSGYQLGLYGRAQLGSNGISTGLVWDAYQGKHLDRKKREAASNRSRKNNPLGLDLDYGLFVKHLPDSAKGLGWFVNMAARTHANGSYSQDMLDMALFGNAMFAGETAELGNLKANYMDYRQFGVGILKQVKRDAVTWNLGFGVSLLTGNRNFSLRVNDAQLYTDPAGELLEGEVHGSVASSALSGGTYIDANGLGFSASLHAEVRARKFGILLSADDLGMIRWNRELQQSALDTAFVFEGVELDLFSGTISPEGDSIINGLITEEDATPRTVATPGRIRLEGYYALNDRSWQLYAGLQYRFTPSYLPYAYIGTRSRIGAGFALDGRFAYGGFGSWHIGFQVEKRFGNRVLVRVGTANLEGFILPMVGTSQSVYASLAVRLN